MRTPHNPAIDPDQDRIIFPREETLLMMGYEFLGWNPDLSDPRFLHCVDNAHNYHAVPNTWHEERHYPDGRDITRWCAKDKIYWKVDLHEQENSQIS